MSNISAKTKAKSTTLTGIAVSSGMVIGRAVVIDSKTKLAPLEYIADESLEAELRRLDQAFNLVINELQKLLDGFTEDSLAELRDIVETHLLMAQDLSFQTAIKNWITTNNYSAEKALQSQATVLAKHFDAVQDAYLKTRKTDILQIIERLLSALYKQRTSSNQRLQLSIDLSKTGAVAANSNSSSPQILIIDNLLAGDLLQLQANNFSALITQSGSKYDHVSIVAQSMRLPMIVSTKNATKTINQGDLLLIDAEDGIIHCNPTTATIEAFKQKQQIYQQTRQRFAKLKQLPTRSQDGVNVELLTNISFPDEIDIALSTGAAGVGLLRSEFLFLTDNDDLLFDENKRVQIYSELIRKIGNKPLVIRSLDVSNDKTPTLSGIEVPSSTLGLRSLRWSLQQKNIFIVELKAILRTAAIRQFDLLIPMVSSLTEVQQLQQLLQQARQQLSASKLAFGDIRLGLLVEVPAVAISIEEFLPHFDFVSIGTNDLTQYTLAVDRTDDSVAHLYDNFHPAVLYLIQRVINAAKNANKEVTLCGELAGDTKATKILLAMGLTKFSMPPANILPVKEQVLQINIKETERDLEQLLHQMSRKPPQKTNNNNYAEIN